LKKPKQPASLDAGPCAPAATQPLRNSRVTDAISDDMKGCVMTDHTYRVIEIAGSSQISHADAIDNAITRAAKTTRHLRWFEVTQLRGEIENGEIQHYQVTMKIGFTLED